MLPNKRSNLQKYLTCIIFFNLAENADNTTYFLGGFRFINSPVWQWAENTTLWGFTDFFGSEPNGNGTERCVQIQPASGWADVNCDALRHFICAYNRKCFIVLSKKKLKRKGVLGSNVKVNNFCKYNLQCIVVYLEITINIIHLDIFFLLTLSIYCYLLKGD